MSYISLYASCREDSVAKARIQHPAAVGVAEHGNSAVLVTVTPDGEFLDPGESTSPAVCRRIPITTKGRGRWAAT
jgi:hypothetical protein